MPTARAASTTWPARSGTTARTTAGPASSAWTFKNGAWFYGSYRWSEADGTWRTNAPEAPKSVACETIPAFAGKVVPTTGQPRQGSPGAEAARRRAGTAEERPSPRSRRSSALPADGNAARASECKKYFPSVGEMLPVPCTNERSSL